MQTILADTEIKKTQRFGRVLPALVVGVIVMQGGWFLGNPPKPTFVGRVRLEVRGNVEKEHSAMVASAETLRRVVQQWHLVRRWGIGEKKDFREVNPADEATAAERLATMVKVAQEPETGWVNIKVYSFNPNEARDLARAMEQSWQYNVNPSGAAHLEDALLKVQIEIEDHKFYMKENSSDPAEVGRRQTQLKEREDYQAAILSGMVLGPVVHVREDADASSLERVLIKHPLSSRCLWTGLIAGPLAGLLVLALIRRGERLRSKRAESPSPPANPPSRESDNLDPW